jgi:hypothetical protein
LKIKGNGVEKKEKIKREGGAGNAIASVKYQGYHNTNS